MWRPTVRPALIVRPRLAAGTSLRRVSRPRSLEQVGCHCSQAAVMSSSVQHPDPEAAALREEIVKVARMRAEVHEFRSTELADIARGREAAERREDAAVANCARRVAEVADQLAQEAIERELHTLDDEEAELSDLNTLRMRVAEQDVRLTPAGEPHLAALPHRAASLRGSPWLGSLLGLLLAASHRAGEVAPLHTTSAGHGQAGAGAGGFARGPAPRAHEEALFRRLALAGSLWCVRRARGGGKASLCCRESEADCPRSRPAGSCLWPIVCGAQAVAARCVAELALKREAARAVSSEYDSVLRSVAAARQGVAGQSAAEKEEDAELAAEQARLLRGGTQATHGATAKLEADWEHHRSTVVAAVRAQWKRRLAAAAGSPDAVRSQLGSVSSTARGLARETAADMAASAAATFDDHAAPLCRQLEAEAARLGARAVRAAAVASRLRATLAEASRARDKADAARRVRRVLDEAQDDALAVDAADPLTSGAGPGFTGEARAQLAAVRDEALRLWSGLGEVGERELMELSVLLAATAVALEPGAGAEASQAEDLRRFRDEARDEARRLMTAQAAAGRGDAAAADAADAPGFTATPSFGR